MSTNPTTPPGSGNDDRGPGLQAFVTVMVIVTVVAITLRFWSRSIPHTNGRSKRRFWWDDWVALAAVPAILTQCALSFAIYLVYDLGLYLTKTSALLFYSRIFPSYTNDTWFKITMPIVHALNTAWFIGIVLGTFLMCKPVAKNWNPTIPGTCGSTLGLFIGSAVPSVVIDLVILLMPLPKVWHLQTNATKKIGLTVVFALGYSVVVVSLGRLVTVLTSGNALDVDITYEGIPSIYWVTAEPPVTLLSICLPAMLPLGRHVAAAYFSPLASKISSFASWRGSRSSGLKTTTGEFPSQTASSTERVRLQAMNHSNAVRSFEHSERGSIASRESSRGILRISPRPGQYTATVYSGRSREDGMNDLVNQSIRVGTDFSVNRNDIPRTN
ncbi:hypothetical protein DL765_007663 [Monosporascus sp. GIB2]|nr:hypothetical protein DL765_007663 [Monosporascus sp. GIB2]